ncbi:MAG: TRAP transporter substrate-binding protein DctP [Sandaracinaceae bacterium]
MRRVLPTRARRLLLILLLPGLAACGGARGEVWRFAIEETPGSVQDAFAQRFRELVDEETGGEVRVVVYPYGALGTSDHITEQLHMGTLELAMASPGHLGKLIPEVQALLLHFAMSEDEKVNAEALRDPAVRAFLDRLFAEKGLAFLTAFGEGWMVWTTQRPVHTPADLEGVRFRVMTSPLLVAAYRAYGAVPTPLPYAEVYGALQLGMIEAQVNPVFAIQEMGFHEVTDHLVFPRHAEFTTTLAANPGWLDGLDAPRRALVERTVDRLQDEIVEIQRRFNQERLARIQEQRPGVQVIELDDDEREAFRQRAASVRERYVALAGPRGAELLDVLDEAIARAARP